ncbi:MAG TPA: hypothetical protein VJU86_07135 [Pyrinomonadaceae bacterium]|nr:hypothetical protein [Pyrinomonadaceae bacterium]
MSTYIVSGKVIHKESGSGIPNLLVDLFDIDSPNDPETPNVNLGNGEFLRTLSSPNAAAADVEFWDRLGSVITDEQGRYKVEFGLEDANLPGETEKKPDLMLVVLAPDEPGLEVGQRVLHFSRYIRYNIAGEESEIVRLPTSLLKAKGIPIKEETEEVTDDRVTNYINLKEREKQFNAGVAEYHLTKATAESKERKVFRQDIIKRLATDFSLVTSAGVVVQDGESILEKNTQTIKTGIAKANGVLDGEARGVPVNLYLTTKDQEDLASFLNSPGPLVEIPGSEIQEILFRTNSSENPGTLLIHNNPIANFCASESFEVKCAKDHTGLSNHNHDPETPENPTTPSNGGLTDEKVLSHLNRLVKDMPTPDTVLQPELRADKTQIEKDVNEFSLQKGPAEVPAFYDMSFLQIAFDHVWKQLFDETIPNLAFTANTLGQTKLGLNSIVGNVLKGGGLAADTFHSVGSPEVSPVIARYFDITAEEMVEMSFAMRQQLMAIAQRIDTHPAAKAQDLRRIQSLMEQGERLIDSVKHDNYYTLHRTLRDLHERLSGKYEFTVFAADKDYHSVNFGLVTTYRQEWTPLMYQAGKLVRTMPLAPREERKYAIKTTRSEKRSSKEARKNNSSITTEQHSTSRVESDIMAKVQQKTTFNFSAEGDYDIGISEGKASTSFGVEAINESAQNRKDFREAVMKAVQDYKEETSTEVISEVETTSEYNESGTISNPNDALAATCLFYELQKRYRVSEQLYRVMPVVLVAQEVPSPDQITPAWVISHDWILNRFLLDDSFRPTLSYIANNSVGEDFSLRELRKNLRQQRSLVETLKIEFAAASQEAENKYAALLKKIDSRVSEQAESDGEGFFTNVAAFFGDDDANPDVARAREMAASDEHKFAVERAEKISVGLQQEVRTLHALTENYNKTLQARLDNETKVKRFLVHITKNIFYYMQAIWSMEPPDQRYLRLHKVSVPVLELDHSAFTVKVEPQKDIFGAFREPGTKKYKAFMHGGLKHAASGAFPIKSLVEVADLHKLIGCTGNYLIFPMKEHNALTEFMAAPFIDRAFGAMDPDELSNVSLDEYSKYVCCLHDMLTEDEFNEIKDELEGWLMKLLATPLRNGDEIVVPTGSLFIKMLVDNHPILEDFKLKHRELDVFKALEEVRRGGLESLRLASRLLHNEREDPDVEKKIVVEGAASIVVPEPEV